MKSVKETLFEEGQCNALFFRGNLDMELKLDITLETPTAKHTLRHI